MSRFITAKVTIFFLNPRSKVHLNFNYVFNMKKKNVGFTVLESLSNSPIRHFFFFFFVIKSGSAPDMSPVHLEIRDPYWVLVM